MMDTIEKVLGELAGCGFRSTFTVDDRSIPFGVRCASCGRDHLPARLQTAELRHAGEVWIAALVCPSCAAAGRLVMVAGPSGTPAENEVLQTLRANGTRTLANE